MSPNCEVARQTPYSGALRACRRRVLRLAAYRLQKGEQQGAAQIGKQVEIKGWVRTLRAQKTFAFVEIYDGSCMAGLQVVVNDSVAGYDLVGDGSISTGCSVAASGELVESLGGKQTVELKASSLRLIGALQRCQQTSMCLCESRCTGRLRCSAAHQHAASQQDHNPIRPTQALDTSVAFGMSRGGHV